jgi:hypothetical protein
MTLELWLENRWLVQHQATRAEIASLLALIDRDLNDARVASISPDWRLAIAYNSALQCAVAALAASGYRPGKGGSHHYYAIESLRFTLEYDEAIIDTLDAFRKKRNVADYERAGTTTDTEVQELIDLASQMRQDLLDWLASKHPDLAPRR